MMRNVGLLASIYTDTRYEFGLERNASNTKSMLKYLQGHMLMLRTTAQHKLMMKLIGLLELTQTDTSLFCAIT